MSNRQHDRLRISPAMGTAGWPQQRAPQPPHPREELTHDALARHIAPEPPRHPAERPRPPVPPGQPKRTQTQPSPLDPRGWSQKQLMFAGAGGMVLLSLLVFTLVLLLSPGTPPVDKSIEARLEEDAEAGLQSVSVSPAEAATAPDQDAPPVKPVLTTSSMIETVPAAAVPFPIAIDGTDGVPARSAVAVAGLPSGARFSVGRPFGADGWNLRTDEIGDVALTVPPSAAGTHDIDISVVTAQGDVIAAAKTKLVVQGSTPADPTPGTVAQQGGQQSEPALQPAAATAPASETAAAAETEQGDGANAPAQRPSALAPPSGDAPSADAKWMTATTAVNMRDKPSSSGKAIGVVQKGNRVQVSEEQYGWLKATDTEKGQTGWIYERFLKAAE